MQFHRKSLLIALLLLPAMMLAQETLLLRQPDLHGSQIAFCYGADVWVTTTDGSSPVRITSTPAVEQFPSLSPDGTMVAFTSNRSGSNAVYVVSTRGGTPTRLTWHPMGSSVRGWSDDGAYVYYVSGRDYAPKPNNRLWKVPVDGGNPTMVSSQRVYNAAIREDLNQMAIEPISRWDVEWRNYRGGQNTPIVILNMDDLSETLLPHEHTTDVQPVWVGNTIYFLSDRDGVMNIWAWDTEDESLSQITTYEGSDIKWLAGDSQLCFERDGRLHLLDPESGATETLKIVIEADFPWAEPRWEDVKSFASYASLSPSGKRIILEARGDIFTVPVEHGDVRNLTKSPDAADRRPVWSPDGDRVAWFSDEGYRAYRLIVTDQDGMGNRTEIAIGESKLGWEITWSPDASKIAFVDDDLRVRVLDLASGEIQTVGLGGINIERGNMDLTWSPDSRWLAYTRSAENNFRQIMVWSSETTTTAPLTNSFANVRSPSWDRDGEHLYFLGSTDVALGSGWANTSAMTADPEYAVYVINLQKGVKSPFELRSDEEEVQHEDSEKGTEKDSLIQIDFDQVERRTIAVPMPERPYAFVQAGGEGSFFVAERVPNQPGYTIHEFSLKKREAKEYTKGVWSLSISSKGKKILMNAMGAWKVADLGKPASTATAVRMNLNVKLDPPAEWKQIFEEAWRYEKDYFYDPDLHGRDWDVVHERYAPLLPHVRHRSDLNYLLDQINGELSVGHSFVGGGDYPEIKSEQVGLLGADIVQDQGRWKISHIYTTETWNPGLTSPLDQPGLNIEEGYYLVGINGRELTAEDNLFQALDGTLGVQTGLHLNSSPQFEGSWIEVVEPIRSEIALRQRAWVETNRRMVDSLSGGRLAYVWVPNTSGQGLVSFNRYFFAQQDKEGAVIDERYNGGGLLDDYMVDLMTRTLRAAWTNEVPGAAPRSLPAGILGPKVLLINEMAGSGGDFFPWVFRQQEAGLLIGMTTWGGLVKSSTHYLMIDGGRVTAPDNAIFDPRADEWIGENVGIHPDIEVRMDAQSIQQGNDPQLERAVEELMKQLPPQRPAIQAPEYSAPANIRD